MKKFSLLACAAVAASSLFAQEIVNPEDDEVVVQETEVAKQAVWPAYFAVADIPETPDLIGLRITIPYSGNQENVTGVDFGFIGRSQYFEGFMFNILRNDVKDELSGFQAGLYNTAGQADIFGIQVGLWNETGAIRGVQGGLVNIAGEVEGFQVGIINRCEEMYGFQIGLVNIIRDGEIPFMPFVNVGF